MNYYVCMLPKVRVYVTDMTIVGMDTDDYDYPEQKLKSAVFKTWSLSKVDGQMNA